MQGTDKTYIYTAKSPGDVWTAHSPIRMFYYDLGILIDDDDTIYIAHGMKTIQVAKVGYDQILSFANALTLSGFQIVHVSEDYIEGARMYKIQGTYHIWVTKSGDTQRMFKYTLTHRTIGPRSIATFRMDTSKMMDGDRGGTSMFRDESAYIAIHRDGENAKLVHVDGIKTGPVDVPVGFMNARPVALDWKCITPASVGAETPLRGDQVWLRINVDLRAGGFLECRKGPNNTTFEYSYDGREFTQLGPTYQLSTSTAGCVGYRFGLFNFATPPLGGELRIKPCDFQIWDPTS
ncbi:hypothetical protein BJX65DRAFT_315082 [Aspergillus insuetus]